MNKKAWVQILITAESCTTSKEVWTVEEIRDRANGNISQKQVRRAFAELEDMGLISHERNAKNYYFKEPSF